MNYVNTKEAREMLRITASTLRRWDKEGKIKTIRTPSGIRLYDKECIKKILNQKGDLPEKQLIAYCRVSSKHQSNDLERQKDFYKTNYPNHNIYSDIGSGLNFKRKGLCSILERVIRGEVKEVVVSHKDRLCRFAFELIQWIFDETNTKLVVLDHPENKSSREELAEDILSIITVFSCRENGKRRYKSKKDTAEVIEESKTDV